MPQEPHDPPSSAEDAMAANARSRAQQGKSDDKNRNDQQAKVAAEDGKPQDFGPMDEHEVLSEREDGTNRGDDHGKGGAQD
ncbi:MAG: hypothetical protein JWO72_1211 [Caulobacteraceae bacterium]|nr:hypothetical protein [Caulobacteraceae bacterium]